MFTHGGQVLISGSGNGVIGFWNLGNGTCHSLSQSTVEPPNTDVGITSFARSADGNYLVVGSMDGVNRIWDLRSGNLVQRLRGHSEAVYSIACTPDGRGLVSGSLDRTVKYWDVGHALQRSTQMPVGGANMGAANVNGVLLSEREVRIPIPLPYDFADPLR